MVVSLRLESGGARSVLNTSQSLSPCCTPAGLSCIPPFEEWLIRILRGFLDKSRAEEIIQGVSKWDNDGVEKWVVSMRRKSIPEDL